MLRQPWAQPGEGRRQTLLHPAGGLQCRKAVYAADAKREVREHASHHLVQHACAKGGKEEREELKTSIMQDITP